MNIKVLTLFLFSIALGACGDHKEIQNATVEPALSDTAAMHRLQGMWVDSETDSPLFRVHGDSVYFPDDTSLPVQFTIIGDTLKIANISYQIESQKDYSFSFYNMAGELIHARKSDETEDSLLYMHMDNEPIIYNEVTKRDTVFIFDGQRYHAYITINPTSKKIFKTSFTPEGVAVKNFYFDNVIHVSLYSGKTMLYGCNFDKDTFVEIIPDKFLAESTLSDIVYSHCDKDGCHFNAKICIPDGAACYMVDITISYTGDVKYQLLDF